MILEHAVLDVVAGQETDFEWAFGQVRELISASPGFLGLELLRSFETPSCCTSSTRHSRWWSTT